MANKIVIIAFFVSLLGVSVKLNAQNNANAISLMDVHVHGLLVCGTYLQLVELQGFPICSFISYINPISPRCQTGGRIIGPKDTIQCEHLIYDACEYIRVGDSVQLVFVDLRKTMATVYINNVVITPKINQKKFLSIITSQGWWPEEQSQYRIGRIESHYYTYSSVKNFSVDFKENPYSSAVFTFYNRLFDKRIWWIEFPTMIIEGFVH